MWAMSSGASVSELRARIEKIVFAKKKFENPKKKVDIENASAYE